MFQGCFRDLFICFYIFLVLVHFLCYSSFTLGFNDSLFPACVSVASGSHIITSFWFIFFVTFHLPEDEGGRPILKTLSIGRSLSRLNDNKSLIKNDKRFLTSFSTFY